MNILLVGKCVVLLEAFADSTEFFVALQDKKMQALRKGDDPLSQKDLGRKIENAPINKDALESTSGHSARNIPPYNSSAITPQEAYPLDGIILTGEWDFLEDIYKILQVGGEVASNAYPTFVCNRIQKLREIQVK
jgi:DNA-directed RNA polymerase I subunit RPA49